MESCWRLPVAKRSPTESDLNNIVSSGVMEVLRTDLVEHEGYTDQVKELLELGDWLNQPKRESWYLWNIRHSQQYLQWYFTGQLTHNWVRFRWRKLSLPDRWESWRRHRRNRKQQPAQRSLPEMCSTAGHTGPRCDTEFEHEDCWGFFHICWDDEDGMGAGVGSEVGNEASYIHFLATILQTNLFCFITTLFSGSCRVKDTD